MEYIDKVPDFLCCFVFKEIQTSQDDLDDSKPSFDSEAEKEFEVKLDISKLERAAVSVSKNRMIF